MSLEVRPPRDRGDETRLEPQAGAGRPRFSRASLGLLLACAGMAAVTVPVAATTPATPGAGGPPLVNVLSGALLGLALVASMQLLSDAAGTDPIRGLRAGVAGTFARMAMAALGLWAAATRPWFAPIPFLAAFAAIYFSLGLALVMGQRPGLPAPVAAGGGDPR